MQQKIMKFAIVGLVGTGLDFSVFSACLLLGLGATSSRGIGYVAGALWAFLLNRRWVFNSSSGWSKLTSFSLTYVISGSFAVFIQSFGPDNSDNYGAIFFAYSCSVLFSAAINFFALRYLVFRS